MEYYPIYITIKTWINKNRLLTMLLVSLSISPFVITQQKFPQYISGPNFEKVSLDYGTKELVFHFDQNMITFASYEDSVRQWEKLLELSFNPPQNGTIRTISTRSFSYQFDTPIPFDQSLTVTYRSNINSLSGIPPKISINYQHVDSQPFFLPAKNAKILYANRATADLKSPVLFSTDVPIQLKQLKKQISIKNNTSSKSFQLHYQIYTNNNGYNIHCVITNYTSFKLELSHLKKNQHYTLQQTNSSNNSLFTYNFKTFGSATWIGLSDKNYMPNFTIDDNESSELLFPVNSSFWLLNENPLNISDDLESILSITPEVEKLNYEIHSQGIKINGEFKGQQQYTITFTPKNLKDVFNQPITNIYTTNFSTQHLKPEVKQIENLVYLNRKNPILSFQAVNVSNITMTYQVINSAYYTALSLYGRAVPVPMNRTNFSIESPIDQITWHNIDLSSLITNQTMLLLVNIQDAKNLNNTSQMTRVIMTSTSLLAHISSTDVIIFARNLKTQAPLESMMISIWDPNRGSFQDLGRTRSDGILRIPNPRLPIKTLEKPIFIGLFEERHLADQVAILSGDNTHFQGINNSIYFNSSPQLIYNDITRSQQISSLVFTDRLKYRIGETVNISALARIKTNNQFSTQNEFFKKPVQIQITGPNNQKLTNFSRTWSSLGSINFSISSNFTIISGQYNIEIKQSEHNFFTQQFFTVETLDPKTAEIIFYTDKTNYIYNDKLQFSLRPQFIFGSPLPSKIHYKITSSPTHFISKKFPNYQFGNSSITPYSNVENSALIIGKGQTSSRNSTLNIAHILKSKSSQNQILTLEALAKSDNIPDIFLSPKQFNVYQPIQLGLQLSKHMITNNEELLINNIIINPLTDELIPDYISSITISKETEINLGKLSFLTNAIGLKTSYKKNVLYKKIKSSKSNISYTPKEEGIYHISYYTHTNGVKIETSSSFVVLNINNNRISQNLDLELDKSIYKSGEKALVYIKNPFINAQLFVSVNRDSVREFYSMTTTNSLITLPIALTHQDEPGLNITAVLSPISNANAPSILYGSVPILMTPNNKHLQIQVQTERSNYTAQEEVKIEISAYNSLNQAVDGEAIVIVRDRAILNDNNDCIPDPVEHFYNTMRPHNFSTWDSSKPLLETSGLTNYSNNIAPIARIAYASSFADDNMQIKTKQSIRSNFPYTLHYEKITLNKTNKTTASFIMPDNISSFDITVVAYNNSQLFGKTNIQFTSFKQLIIDEKLPFFLRAGDIFNWSPLIRNFSDELVNTEITVKNSVLTLKSNMSLLPHSSIHLTQTVNIDTNINNWEIISTSEKYNDHIIKNVPIINNNPWLASSDSGILISNTNLTIDTSQDASQKMIQIQLSSTPAIKIKEEYQQLWNSSSLTYDTLSRRVLVFLGNEELISQQKLIPETSGNIKTKLQQDIDLLSSYYKEGNNISLTPSGIVANDAPFVLQLYEILILAKNNNYVINQELFTKLSRQTQQISRNNPNTIIQATAVNLLVNSKLLDMDSFNSIYTNLSQNLISQALILDSMYKLGFSLSNISEQTQILTKRLSETSTEILLPEKSRYFITSLIKYYGGYFEGLKILNGLDTHNSSIFAYSTFLSKYHNFNSSGGQVIINDQKFTVSESNPTIEYPTQANNLNISIQANSSNTFYNLTYLYTPKDKFSQEISGAYKIEKTIYDKNNKVISDNNLFINETYRVELEITSSLPGIQNIEIIDPLYAGTVVIPETNSNQNNYIIDIDKIYIYTTLTGATKKKVEYNISTRHSGAWFAPQISVRAIRNAATFSTRQQRTLFIK